MDWTPIKKITAAIIVAAVIDAGALLGVLSGAMSWREAGIAAVASALPVVRGYLVSDPEVRAGLEKGYRTPPAV